MVRAVASLRVASLAAAVLLVGGVAASAQTVPTSKASRELVRRVLLDACVYQESAKLEPAAEADDKDKPKAADKRSAAQQKIVDACQCASARAMKPVTDEQVAKVDETRQVPDDWYTATTEAYPGCKR